MLSDGESLGTIAVVFGDPDLERPTAVKIEIHEGITPTRLDRFAWTHWLTAADEIVRGGMPPVPSEKLAEALQHGSGRPGRRGHPEAFFDNVARRYRQLRLDGNRAPVATIASEAGVSRNTAAGWIKAARARGLLAPARRT